MGDGGDESDEGLGGETLMDWPNSIDFPEVD